MFVLPLDKKYLKRGYCNKNYWISDNSTQSVLGYKIKKDTFITEYTIKNYYR